MTAAEKLIDTLKQWPVADLQRFACKLLILNNPSFHGNITLHYAHGIVKKKVASETEDM